MITLSTLRDTHRPSKSRKRKGRGPGSNKGKTCCRGHKGDKSRSGYKRRGAKEGGQLPLFQKLPHRGFSNAPFAKRVYAINLDRIDALFEDGDVVTRESLMERGIPLRRIKGGIKILANGEITKKIAIKANKYSKNAIVKLEKQGIEFSSV